MIGERMSVAKVRPNASRIASVSDSRMTGQESNMRETASTAVSDCPLHVSAQLGCVLTRSLSMSACAPRFGAQASVDSRANAAMFLRRVHVHKAVRCVGKICGNKVVLAIPEVNLPAPCVQIVEQVL